MDTLATVKDLDSYGIEYADEKLAGKLLESVSAAVRDAAGCPSTRGEYTATIPGETSRWLDLPMRPVISVSRVLVDGELPQEDYVNDLTYLDEGTQFPLTLGEGELFLMGDNRNRSSDSRDERLGAVDERLIIGKAVLLVFPGRDSLTDKRDFSRLGSLKMK